MLVLQGVALFAFVPLVLWLYLAQPLGPGWSLALGLAIMSGHRSVGGPWASRHALERCLWCGRQARPAAQLDVVGRAGRRAFAVCSASHLDRARRFFSFTHRFRVPIGLGILLPLAVLLGGTLAQALGHPWIPHDLNVWQFRTIVAATVVTTSLAYAAAAPRDPARSPFPVHNLFLLGVRNTLWVFRLVGAWWLLAGLSRVVPGG